MDFVAIDFETANEHRNSPCAVAVVVVIGGELVDQRAWLIRPKEPYFNPFNVRIHGITEEDVADQPEFDDLWDTLGAFLLDRIVLAHNASFDMSVLRSTLATYGIPFPEMTYSCTRVIAQKSWPGLLSYGLQPVAMKLGIEFNHHLVEDDAYACAKVAIHACHRAGVTSIESLATQLEIENGRIFPVDGYVPVFGGCPGRTRNGSFKIAEIVPTTDSFDPTHPFYDRVFVFTGELESMCRKDAMQAVVDVGGHCGSGVSKKTNVLIIGEQDLSKLVPGHTKSGKMLRAEELVAEGADLEIMSELEFLRTLIGHDQPTRDA
jgi:DNA polymerase III subunit epsilon